VKFVGILGYTTFLDAITSPPRVLGDLSRLSGTEKSQEISIVSPNIPSIADVFEKNHTNGGYKQCVNNGMVLFC